MGLMTRPELGDQSEGDLVGLDLPGPSILSGLSSDQCAAALVQLAALQAALAARLRGEADRRSRQQPDSVEGRLLTPEEAAKRIGVPKRWIHRHSKDLPFARRLGRKTLRIWEPGLERWMREKKP
jgi:hypothetical protein